MNTKIYICYTYYHILVSAVKRLVSQQPADILLCNINGAFENDIYERVKDSAVFENVFWWDEDKCEKASRRNVFSYLIYRYVYINAVVQKYLHLNLKDYQDIYIYCDVPILGKYLNINHIPYHLLEDAKNGFQYKVLSALPIYREIIGQRFSLRLGQKLGLYPMIYGKSRNCIDIEVNSLEGLLELKHIRKKAKVLEKDLLFAQITPGQVSQVVKIFAKDHMKLPEVDNLAIIFTQPLFQDQFVEKEERQQQIYKTIFETYKSEYKIIIKPHPRDRVTYSFEGAIVLPRDFPSEIISLMGEDRFQLYITLFSSAVFSYPKDKVIFLGKGYIDEH